MKLNSNLVILAGLAIGGGYVLYKGKQAVSDAANAINPVNNDNIFARGVNSIVQAVTGDDGTSLGSEIYDWVNGTPLATRDQLRNLGTTNQGN